MAELRDLYDINSNKTDKTYHKGEKVPEGYYPMVVMVVIRNSKGEFLMQKRVEKKGGDWGVTGGRARWLSGACSSSASHPRTGLNGKRAQPSSRGS